MPSPHLVLVLILILVFLPSILSDPSTDRSALLRLRTSIRGRTLLWNTTSVTSCSWEGITCNTTTNRVIALRLPGDGLKGHIPPNSIGNLIELQVLSLRENSLSGELPSDLASCTQLRDLHLQGNRFSGEIPARFFTLTNLLRVNLARNNFSGTIPSGFNNMTKLRTLFLEKNHFNGSLPDFYNLVELRNFNVSFNGLEGFIPLGLSNFSTQSFLGTSLCGGPLVSCSGKNLSGGAIAGITIGSCIGLLVIILIVFFFYWRKHRKRKFLPQIRPILEHEIWNPKSVEEKKKVERDGLVLLGLGGNVEVFSLQELMSSSAEVVDEAGSVGSTYKVYLESGVEVIVMRLKGVCVSEEEFRDEIEEVGSLVHENLEGVRGYYYGTEEKLLLYEPMVNYGSLSALLHGSNKRSLPWEMRAKIALETANGMNYLHSRSPTTTHGNIKSSNIFITDYYNARISEFGLTPLISPLSNHNGYKAPEVIDTHKITQKSDVYSFGVLLLELLSGKEPDSVLTEEGIELPNWVKSVVEERWKVEVFDPDLVIHEDKMVHFLHLALSCSHRLPDMRPSMAEVTRRIKEISS